MKILIVDDEPPARDRLKRLIEELDGCECAGEAGNGTEAISLVSRLSPDVVLLDIRMPGMDGVEAAQHLSRLEEPPAVIFVTAYDEYALRAFDAQAVGYLLKPVR
jgi:two-component system response regulator AlgR